MERLMAWAPSGRSKRMARYVAYLFHRQYDTINATRSTKLVKLAKPPADKSSYIQALCPMLAKAPARSVNSPPARKGGQAVSSFLRNYGKL